MTKNYLKIVYGGFRKEPITTDKLFEIWINFKIHFIPKLVKED